MMASGFCDFCQVWHSASCAHPGRAEIERLKAELESLARTNASLGVTNERLKAELGKWEMSHKFHVARIGELERALERIVFSTVRDCTTGEGHARCIGIASNALAAIKGEG